MFIVLDLLKSATAEGLLWAFLGIGVHITYRVLHIPDLTAEGSFPLGAGIAIIAIKAGYNPIIASFFGFLGGMGAGLVSGILHARFKIPPLLSGIITMTGLYSITSRVLGGPNVSILGEKTIFTWIQNLGVTKHYATIIVSLIFITIFIIILYLFFATEIGLAIISTGDNPDMSEANGIEIQYTKLLGYMISNGCIAFSGALIAQNNSFADLNSGVGTIVIGLASIIIAEVIIPNKTIAVRFVTIVLGAIIYRLIIRIVLELNIEPTDLKLASAAVLFICLTLPQMNDKINFNKKSNNKNKSNKNGGQS